MEAISVEDFLNSNDLISEQARVVRALIEDISNRHNGVPKEYRRLLSNIVKSTPVVGLLQVSSNLPLEYLMSFALQRTNLRAAENQTQLRLVQIELPVFWQIIIDIMKLENGEWLPIHVAKIVRLLIRKRITTFSEAVSRQGVEYFPWDDQNRDHPTSYYPFHPILRLPKKYAIKNKRDDDFCSKFTQDKQNDFGNGFFSIGCACPNPITYGFELCLAPESEHNLSRFLLCRRINFKRLSAVIFDFACGLHEYVLNREPKEIEHIKFLVDGSHWNGHKKNKKTGHTSGGHIGCSESYNFNNYKDTFEFKLNSQGREQLHREVNKAVSSLSRMNYYNFMTSMKVFLL